jgi:hypothetical protein
MTFHLLRLVTGRTEVISNLQDCFGQPFGRHVTPVIELKGK